jgi:hypothetical protein
VYFGNEIGKILCTPRSNRESSGETQMSVSRNTDTRSRREYWRQVLGQFSRYDLLLAAIPLVFALALSVYALAPVSLEVALAGGALLSGLCFVDAVYINPPIERSSDS